MFTLHHIGIPLVAAESLLALLSLIILIDVLVPVDVNVLLLLVVLGEPGPVLLFALLDEDELEVEAELAPLGGLG